LQNKWRILAILLTLFVSIVAVVFLRPSGLALNVSAVETSETLGAFWDAGCSVSVISVDWGNMTPGQTKSTIFYVKNEGSTTVFLSAIDKNWNPTAAQNYIHFIFDSNDQKVKSNEVRKVACSLIVSKQTVGVTNYSFDVLLLGTDYMLTDVNRDGKVDMKDIAFVAMAFDATPTSIKWNPNADLNRDLKINMLDVAMVCQDLYKTD
jgi:hypothetical protein